MPATTPAVEEVEGDTGVAAELGSNTAMKVRRSIARVKLRSQGQLDVAALAELMPQRMGSKAREGPVPYCSGAHTTPRSVLRQLHLFHVAHPKKNQEFLPVPNGTHGRICSAIERSSTRP